MMLMIVIMVIAVTNDDYNDVLSSNGLPVIFLND